MSSASESAASLPPAPSVFISYASEDRSAARALRDTLLAAGLDVWYDENELGGGDAWDQKIRRQIRDCDYFMPLISAATEARKEGYFRREWRLATERMMDMADDVLFLLPVTLDETSEVGSRVPEKFLHFQWLRAPGGQATPALHALLRRLLAGEHTVAPSRPSTGLTRAPFQTMPPIVTDLPLPPPALTRPPLPPTASAPPPIAPPVLPAPEFAAPSPTRSPHPPPAAPPGPPPMPAFPSVPEKGGFLHGIKFLAEVLWWALTAGWLLFNRAPRWLRIVFTVWVVITMFSRCGSDQRNNPEPPPRRTNPSQQPPQRPDLKRTQLRQAIERVAAAHGQKVDGKSRLNLESPSDLAKFGADLARTVAAELDEKSPGKLVTVIPPPAGTAEDPSAKLAASVYALVYAELVTTRPGVADVLDEPAATETDEALAAQGRKLHTGFFLITQAAVVDGVHSLTVRLLRTENATVAWSATYPAHGADPAALAEKIAAAVLAVLPPPPAPPLAPSSTPAPK